MVQRKPRLHGLRPSRRHPGRNWQLDCDYADKLSQDELAWLSRFYEESYHSAPWREGVSLHSQEVQRALWRAYKANERDALTRSAAFNLTRGGLGFDAEGDSREEARFQKEQAKATRGACGHDYMSPGGVEDLLVDAIDTRAALARREARGGLPEWATRSQTTWGPKDGCPAAPSQENR